MAGNPSARALGGEMNTVRINITNTAPLAVYTFLSFLRRGISTEISRVDGGSKTVESHAALSVTIEIEKEGLHTANVNLAVQGPGEIIGFDSRVAIRVAPGANVFNAEPNFFPLIEFDQPDFPWRFTPASSADGARLRPWLCLIALADGEFKPPALPPDPTKPFPLVTVHSATMLPDLAQSWAWAHAQVSGQQSDGQLSEDFLANLLVKEPHRVISRLLCPRRLQPQTAYTAMLVPAFERGRRRGLGDDPDEIKNDGSVIITDALKPAWESSISPVTLPVYYQWRFQTGAQGDFESLVKQLKARSLPPTVGIRLMDVSQPDPRPGSHLPGASAVPLGLEGALKTAATKETKWDETERQAFIEELRKIVNLPSEIIRSTDASGGAQPKATVAPPLYGRWHAAQETLDAVPPDSDPIWWFQRLNSDPRWRVIAGLGTQVVQTEQRQLLAGAWQQVGEVRKANEILRLAQLGREAANRINQRHITVSDTESYLWLTVPLQGRVRGGQSAPPLHTAPPDEAEQNGQSESVEQPTVRGLIQRSRIAAGALDPAYVRISRPNGPIRRRQMRPGQNRKPPDILDRMNSGDFSPAPDRTASPDMTTPGRVGKSLVPDWCTRLRLEKMRKQSASDFEADLVRRADIRDDFRMTANQIIRAPRRHNFIASPSSPGTSPSKPQTPPPPGGGALQFDSQSARDFRAAAAAMLRIFNAPREQAPELFILNIGSIKFQVMQSLDPMVTIPRSITSRINITNTSPVSTDPLEQIGAAPEFNKPMYESVRDLSQDWLLPGLDQVPADTVALLVTNQRFIESFMVGLSHEMARELLYHEYPLRDQRGSYFRQFWSVAGAVPPAGRPIGPEALKDIKPIHRWGRTSGLGENSSRQIKPGGQQLVLLVRGELLRRYPNAIVYAAKAAPGSGPKHTLLDPAVEEHPIFSGTLKPDVSFFGFNLTPDEARGDPTNRNKPGWFFVLKEHPAEPRFGLDNGNSPLGKPAFWNDLSWGDLTTGAGDLGPGVTTSGHINLAKGNRPNLAEMRQDQLGKAVWHSEPPLSLPNISRGSTAADLAYITLQRPVRIAIHASDMLPPKE